MDQLVRKEFLARGEGGDVDQEIGIVLDGLKAGGEEGHVLEPGRSGLDCGVLAGNKLPVMCAEPETGGSLASIPVIDLVIALGARDSASQWTEIGVFVGMQLQHFARGPGVAAPQAKDKQEQERRLPASPEKGQRACYAIDCQEDQWRDQKEKLAQAIVEY